ncbi:MAG: phage tail protein, partial [Lactococcus sp.]|nr:phage tail protein [Lactococcus sp.]
MSIMILHDKTNNNWNSQGLGPLSEAMNPQVTRERNGAYELNFSYPVKGVLFKELLMGRWIVADAGPSQTAKAQRFEIAEITKPKNGIVTVYCEHYRYQLLRSIVKIGPKIENQSAQTVLNQLLVQMEPKGDFGFTSDIATKSSIDFTDPAKFNNAQEVLGGVQGSILDNFGGEYLFNNNQVKLLSNAGVERNVIIAYGKNLTDISQEESIESTYTSVYGWAKMDGEDGQIITLSEIYIDSDYVDNYTQRRIKMVDFSQDKPANTTDLRNLVTKYIKNNKVGIPKVNIKTSYVDLASSVMDAQLTNLEEIDLCDWVTVLFNQLDINTSAQIIKTVWNVALDKFDSLELGEASTNMSKVISDSQPDLNNITDKIGWLDDAQKEASDILNNPGKGNVVIYPSLADPQEILIMDTKDVNTAKNVWKWNSGGLGFSSTGYKGTYGLAMTNNGAIVADRMTTGTLRALDIIGVSISGSDITGTNIIGGLIKGAQLVQNDNTGSAVLGMKYGKLGFFSSESAAIEGNNAFA